MKIHGRDISITAIPKILYRHVLKYPLSIYENARSEYYLKKLKKTRNVIDSKIRIGFLVQMVEIWDKEEPVYEALKNNPKYDVFLIVIPPFNKISNSIEKEYKNNYFLKKYQEAIPAYTDGAWFDLKDKFDYIFYQRPYDIFLPKEYRSRNLVKYAKCCYIPYGFSGSDNFDEILTDKAFFRNIYFAFLESDYYSNLLKKKFETSKQLHKFESIGYPALCPYFSIRPNRKYKRILWTPRWSYDYLIGGSHFIEYKDTIEQLSSIYPKCSITFRPHQLLFEELIIKSLMTKYEIEEFFHELERNKIRYDTGEPIFETLKNTDILITDYSSIIIQFFITGRPIIYCESSIIPLNECFRLLAEGMYIAKSEKDILKYMHELQNNNDYLYNKRQEIIRIHLNIHRGATENIINRIEEDYFGNK